MDVTIDFSLNATDGTSVRFFTKGKLEQHQRFKRLTFVEQTDALLDTVVDIYINKVFLKRTGKLYMMMEFNPTQETTVVLRTENNFEIKMLNKTESIINEEGKLEIIYQTEMDKDQGIYHQLKINYENVNK